MADPRVNYSTLVLLEGIVRRFRPNISEGSPGLGAPIKSHSHIIYNYHLAIIED